jgi:hypothetical protein
VVPDGADTAQQEREVRLTGQRILATHLRPSRDPGQQEETFWADLDVDLTSATLIDFDLSTCQVRTARFNGTLFTGSANFHGAEFGGGAWFGGAEFGGGALFGGVEFDGDALFGDAKFGRGARFGGFESFYGAEFGGGALFAGAKFGGDAWFDGAKFGRNALFNDVWVRLDADNRQVDRCWPAGWMVSTDPPVTRSEPSGEWAQLVRIPSEDDGTIAPRSTRS